VKSDTPVTAGTFLQSKARTPQHCSRDLKMKPYLPQVQTDRSRVRVTHAHVFSDKRIDERKRTLSAGEARNVWLFVVRIMIVSSDTKTCIVTARGCLECLAGGNY
jgi:hypothetical protein